MPPRTIRVGPLAVDLYEPAAAPRFALLYLHGFGSVRTGQKVVHLGEAVARAGGAMLAPDLQGHGDSEGDFGTITIARSIHDLCAVAELPLFRDADRRLLGGSSFGALTSMWASIDHPELCQQLFLIAPAIRFIERHTEALTPEDLERWRSGQPIRVDKDWFSVDLHSAIYDEAQERSVSELAHRFRHPARIVHGSEDETIALADVEAFVDACANPGLSLRVIPGGDHRLTEHLLLLETELLASAADLRKLDS